MRKVNFNTLNNLTVPPELIEKALAIPTSSENTPAILPWYKRTRPFAAAASIVLVVLTGVFVYFFFGNKKIPVKPSGTSNIPTTIASTVPDGTPSTEPTGSRAAEPQSEQPTGTAAQSATINASSATQPTVITPSGITATEPSVIAPIITPATEPVNKQTETSGVPTPTHSAEPATERPAPTERATEKPAEQPTQAHEMVTDPPEGLPGSGGAGVPGAPAGGVIYSWVNGSMLTGNRRVFCVLYDGEGNRVDSEPILSPKHETFTSTHNDGYAYFTYAPPEEWNLSVGMYEMEIYNESGKRIGRESIFLEP